MDTRRFRSHGTLVLAALALFSVCGCQAPITDVSGRVTLAGKPVVGSVALFPSDGPPVVAALDTDGRYVARGVRAGGEIRVAVYSPDPNEQLQTLPNGPEGEQDRAAVRELRRRWAPIASRYNDPGRSGFAFTPSGPSCTFDVDLKAN